MSTGAPALPFHLDPLIAEAKRRSRRRRALLGALAVAAGAAVVFASLPGGPGRSSPPAAGTVVRLSSSGIGGVRIGSSKAQTVAALSRLFGPPSGRFLSPACGPVYTEVAWSHLYVEFRGNSFSGFRYAGGAAFQSFLRESSWSPRLRPRLATPLGITIGSTLEQVRLTYGRLQFVGTARWAKNGLVFYDGASRFPDPAGSRIVEIKSSVCGDF